MAVAQTQVKQGEYEAAVGSYGEVLKGSPVYGPAQDGQLDAAMLWVENFQVLGDDNNDAAKIAGAKLDEIMPVLDAGLARSKGTREADVQAHLRVGALAELAYCGAGVWAGGGERICGRRWRWMGPMFMRMRCWGTGCCRINGSFAEAIGHLNAAVATGKARPLVRSMQIGGLLHDRDAWGEGGAVKAVNDMRKNNEPLDEDMKELHCGVLL